MSPPVSQPLSKSHCVSVGVSVCACVALVCVCVCVVCVCQGQIDGATPGQTLKCVLSVLRSELKLVGV